MTIAIEKLLEIHEDPNSTLSRHNLSSQIHTTAEALQNNEKMQDLAKTQRLDTYGTQQLEEHYANNYRTYQQMYEMLYGKRRISESKVAAVIQARRRGRK